MSIYRFSENGYYETNGQGYDSNGPIGSFAGDGLPFSKLNDWIYNNDFDTIFKTLKQINYKGTFVLQTAREEAGKELDTVTRHKRIFEELHEKHF